MLKERLEPLGNVIVEGATFLIAADAPVVTVPTPAVASHVLVVSSSSNLLGKDGTKKASLKTDMEGQTPVVVGYINPPYTFSGILTWDGKLSGSQESTKCTKDGSGAIVDDTPSGTVNFDVTTPAENPLLPTPPPNCTPGLPAVPCAKDPSTTYPGTWTLLDANNTALTTNE